VIRSILGMQKTVAYCSLVVVMATFTGVVFVRSIHRGVNSMIKLQVLGKGCSKCVALGQHAEAAAQSLDWSMRWRKSPT